MTGGFPASRNPVPAPRPPGGLPASRISRGPRGGYGLGMDVPGYVESQARDFLDDLKQWLAIPSISGDPAHHDDVRRSAWWLAAHLRTVGFPVAEVLDTHGLPAVFAEWPAKDPSAPVV